VRDHFLKSIQGLDAQDVSIEVLRQNAMVLLMLEEGLTLKEVQKLSLENIEKLPAAYIVAPGHRTLRSREIKVSEPTKKWLEEWVRRRSIMRIRERKESHLLVKKEQEKSISKAASRVFVTLPCGRGGSLDGYVADYAINRIGDGTIREAAEAVVLSAEPNWPKGIVRGPQMLRNLCMMRMIQEGADDDEIVRRFGLVNAAQVRWMRNLLGA